MSGLLPHVDPDGLLEFSVVYTDRALNHMSKSFQGVMKDISGVLKEVYNAHSAILVPGSGTFGMESAARQFATGDDGETGALTGQQVEDGQIRVGLHGVAHQCIAAGTGVRVGGVVGQPAVVVLHHRSSRGGIGAQACDG